MAEIQETKVKKNMDYSDSAVRLVNPKELKNAMQTLRLIQATLQGIEVEIQDSIPIGLAQKRQECETMITKLTSDIRPMIDELGSYQDLDNGIYALKQAKKSKSYKVEPFEKIYPQFAPAVIIKAIDTTKLNGLIKGGLLDEARLEADGILTITESFAYIIR